MKAGMNNTFILTKNSWVQDERKWNKNNDRVEGKKKPTTNIKSGKWSFQPIRDNNMYIFTLLGYTF